jgi:hypothetical protein
MSQLHSLRITKARDYLGADFTVWGLRLPASPRGGVRSMGRGLQSPPLIPAPAGIQNEHQN